MKDTNVIEFGEIAGHQLTSMKNNSNEFSDFTVDNATFTIKAGMLPQEIKDAFAAAIVAEVRGHGYKVSINGVTGVVPYAGVKPKSQMVRLNFDTMIEKVRDQLYQQWLNAETEAGKKELETFGTTIGIDVLKHQKTLALKEQQAAELAALQAKFEEQLKAL